jgi:hypothetical protein
MTFTTGSVVGGDTRAFLEQTTRLFSAQTKKEALRFPFAFFGSGGWIRTNAIRVAGEIIILQ